MALKKRPVALPVMSVVFSDGPLAGHEFLMHEPASSLVFGSADVTDRELAIHALAAVTDSTLDLPDLGQIPTTWSMALANGWLEAWKGAALPPVTGRPSRRRSPEPP
jgi:hypothetical protein